MTEQTKIKVEDLEPEEGELSLEELSKVTGGVSMGTGPGPRAGGRVSRSSDPDSGDEVV